MEKKKNAVTAFKFPDLDDFSSFFNEKEKLMTSLTDTIADVYAWSTSLEPSPDNLPLPFVSKNDEVVWSYLKHQNRQLETMHKKYRGFLKEMPGRELIQIEPKKVESEEEEEDEEEEGEDIDENEEEFDDEEELGDDEEEEEEDLFNLKEEDLKNLDQELKRMENDDDDNEQKSIEPTIVKKTKKSIVDDAFFNLEEMNEFLEKTEKNQGAEKNAEESMIFEDDDNWDGKTTYTYEDFFGSKEDVEEVKKEKGKKTKKRKVENEEELIEEKQQKKKVRFAIDEEEEEEDIEEEEDEGEEDDDDGEDKQELKDQQILLGADLEEKQAESAYAKRQKRLKENIAKLEEENLKPRNWELSGEVAGEEREKNTLLEQHVEFDHGSKRAPEVTEEFTDKLEALIKQRIRDKTFDDVIRVKKIEEKGPKFETEALENIYNKKTALADVYEKEYQKNVEKPENAEKSEVNEAHEEIKKKMSDLFRLIDALTHFEYKPAEAKEEVKVVSNMASLRVEEVGAMASSEAQLIAPEEAAKTMKGIMKGDEEKDKTDKLRERRKKKAKQRALVEKFGEERIFGEAKANKLKKKEKEDGKAEKIKSSNFFSKLQETVQQEKKDGGKTKKKVIKKLKTDKNSLAIKL